MLFSRLFFIFQALFLRPLLIKPKLLALVFNEDKARCVLLCKILNELISFNLLNSGICSDWIKSISVDISRILDSIVLKSIEFASVSLFSFSSVSAFSTIGFPLVTLSIISFTSTLGCFFANDTIFST